MISISYFKKKWLFLFFSFENLKDFVSFYFFHLVDVSSKSRPVLNATRPTPMTPFVGRTFLRNKFYRRILANGLKLAFVFTVIPKFFGTMAWRSSGTSNANLVDNLYSKFHFCHFKKIDSFFFFATSLLVFQSD